MSTFTDTELTMDRLLNRFSEQNRQTHEYIAGVRLYLSEISTLAYIAESSTTNQTDIALQLGFTRGAVSKMVDKLEKAGLLQRYKYYPGQKEIFVHLTEAGLQAYEGYRRCRREMHGELEQFFDGLDKAQQSAVLGYLEKYMDSMQSFGA